MKKIVFLGNCQARRLWVLYNDHFAPITGDETKLIANFEELTPRVAETMADADVIVAQVTDGDMKVTVDKVQTNAQIIEYPYVTGNFLWPHSGREHIWNKPLPHLHDGPFGVQFGNPWLNAKLKAGAKPDDIVAEYETLDLSKAINLDRTYELSLQRARERDRRSGFDLASIIERELTETPLFLSPAQFELPLVRPFAAGVFERLGIPSAAVSAMLDTLWRTVFPPGQHPIHPSVARHFGLKFIGPDTRYTMLTGERLTYREWLSNYVHFRWNDALLEGNYKTGRIKRFDAGAQAVLEQLKAGLAQSTGSVQGETSLAHLLQMKGDSAGALAAIQRAAALDPDNPQTLGSLALHVAATNPEEAGRLLRELTAKWPHYADGWNRLGNVLMRLRKPADAAQAVAKAVAIEPRNPGMRKHLAAILLNAGEADQARAVLAAGIALTPDQADFFGELARVYLKLNDSDNALLAARRAAVLDKANPMRHRQLADICLLRNDATGAVFALRDAIALAPADTALSGQLSGLLNKLGLQGEADTENRRILQSDSTNLQLRHSVAQRLIQSGACQEAETLLAEGISISPFDETLHVALARALAGQARYDEAEAPAARAVQLKPGSPQLRQGLADMLVAAGALDRAEQCYRDAIAVAVDNADLRAALALLYHRMRRLDDGLEAIEQAIALRPNNPHFVARHAFILKEKGAFAEARRVAEAAVALGPEIAGLYITLADVCERGGDRYGALSAYRRTLELEPRNGHARTQADRLIKLIGPAEQVQAAE